MAWSLGTPVLACSVTVPNMVIDHRAAIAEAEWIALVRASRDAENRARLDVIEYLKGDGPPTLDIGQQALVDDDFNHRSVPSAGNAYGHTASGFWAGGPGGCYPIYGFAAEATYLVFGPEAYWLGFENVVPDGDAWVDFVREEIAGSEPAPLFPISLSAYLEGAFAIISVEARYEGGRVRLVEQVLKGEADSYLSYLGPEPWREFWWRLDEDCQPEEGDATGTAIYVIEQAPNPNTHSLSVLNCLTPFGAERPEFARWPENRTQGVGAFADGLVVTLPIIEDSVALGLLSITTEHEFEYLAGRGYRIPLEDFLAAIEAAR